MPRFFLSSVFAALLLAPVVASAQTPAAPSTTAPAATPAPATPAAKTTAHKPMMRHTMRHAAGKTMTKPTRQTATAAGDRAVEQLNDQSLARARAGDTAPASAPK